MYYFVFSYKFNILRERKSQQAIILHTFSSSRVIVLEEILMI